MSENTFRIVPVDSTNAALVGALFRSVYGEDFPVKYVYRPHLLEREIIEERTVASLALDKSGEPAGYVSLFKNAPNPRLWEGGNIIVHPAYKHTDLAIRLFDRYSGSAVHQILNGDGIYGEAVCHHYFTQLACSKSGMADCAIQLDQLDGAGFKEHKPETDRVSCIFYFTEMTDPPETVVYLPDKYADMLEGLSHPLRPRSFLRSTAPLPDRGRTVWEDKYYSSARTWKVSVREVGADWQEVLEEFLREGADRRVISLQIVLNTACPHIGKATELMRRRGFFLGGLTPRWFGTDGMLMQVVLGREPEYDGIKLYTRTSRDLLAFIRADRDEVRSQELPGL